MTSIGLDAFESNSSLRLLYSDEDELLLSPATAPMSPLHWSANSSIKSVTDWNQLSSTPPLSPMVDNRHTNSPGSNSSTIIKDEQHAGKRRSIRKSITHALVSPMRAAKDKISSPSPKKSTRSLKGTLKNSNKEWRKQLNLPPDADEDQAIAVLLAKELSMLDF